ncbi:sugar transferase [Siphonobacter sp. BAB-5385]|uniref:glycosyltransferase n=1 Tax=Siphonobacter sp. BAB-5385 TaxID=1864822 RepID=UPI000B9EE550|nr:glycosyltransferase [Siphonobacter sp. BAB-5385]OZI09066.1 sugar transferase [Siphonobacter sp. BAB-5385]
MYAPIALFCYNRPEHFRKTVKSLLRCPEAAFSTVYIFSDGPKTAADEANVAIVREYAQSIRGFESIHLDFSEENRGLAASIIRGVTQVLQQHDKIVVMEDDLLCTRDYLRFMNEALEYYRKDIRVFSISGYLYPIEIPLDYPHDVLLLARGCSYGWGTWPDRWAKVDWEVRDFPEFMKNKAARREFMRGGEDLLPMLKKQQVGVLNSWAIRWTYAHYKHQAYNLHPRASKLESTGMDGSGTNFGRGTHRYDVQRVERFSRLTKAVSPDEVIHQRLRKHFRLSWIRKIINFVRYGV